MNGYVKEIYMYWVGLGEYHDAKGLPTPIPIKKAQGPSLVIAREYFEKHNITIKPRDSLKQVADRYRYDKLNGW